MAISGKKLWSTLIILTLFLAGTVARAEAASVTMEFVAQVDSVTNVPGVAVGDFVRGRYTFDSALPNTSGDATAGLYVSSGTFSLSGGSLFFAVSPYHIGVGNNQTTPLGPQDFYAVEGSMSIAGVDHFYQLFLSTIDLGQGAITSTALPLLPPEVAKFPDFHRFGYCYGVTGPTKCMEHGIAGPIISLALVEATPVPTMNHIALAVMALLLAFGALRNVWRRSKMN
jgi:hypothetical protein